MQRPLIITLVFLIGTNGDSDSNEIPKKFIKNAVTVYWNIPTFQCDTHNLNFTGLAAKYHITQNERDRFRGDKFSILYDPGAFPAILKQGSKTILRNGGVPQEGNLTFHLEVIKQILEELIPDENFEGIGVLDFESWRPIFRQNFGTLSAYKDLSVKIEKQRHPFWPTNWVENEAKQRFEEAGRKFMEETLLVVKRLRPKATWGYYAYPYCFNMSPSNKLVDCPKEVVAENNKLKWLFEISDNLHPSLYLGKKNLTGEERIQMIEGRISEAYRIINTLNKNEVPKLLPYFWYKYHDTKSFVSKEDLYNSFKVLAASQVDGLVIWGSSNDVNTKENCKSLYKYVDDVLGPIISDMF